jgi:hypothetical protein
MRVSAKDLHGAALHSAFESMHAKLPEQKSRCAFSPTKFPAARWGDIAEYIRDGWRLQYCGPWYNPVSDTIRWKTYGPWSHSAMTALDDGMVNVIQVCAKDGCTESSLYYAVLKNPGRWYVSPLNPAFQFNAEDAVAEARNHIGEQYGFRGIALQTLTAIPFVSAAAAIMQMHRWPYFAASTAFCSGGVKTWATAGGVDPVPNRQHGLCTPLDIAESLLWEPTFCALYPNDWQGW